MSPSAFMVVNSGGFMTELHVSSILPFSLKIDVFCSSICCKILTQFYDVLKTF